MLPLPHQVIVIATMLLFGVLTAHVRPSLVDRATSGLAIEKPARCAVYVILAMSKHAPIARNDLRESLLSLSQGQLETPSQASHVVASDSDPIIGTTVRHALGAIVARQCHILIKLVN